MIVFMSSSSQMALNTKYYQKKGLCRETLLLTASHLFVLQQASIILFYAPPPPPPWIHHCLYTLPPSSSLQAGASYIVGMADFNFHRIRWRASVKLARCIKGYNTITQAHGDL